MRIWSSSTPNSSPNKPQKATERDTPPGDIAVSDTLDSHKTRDKRPNGLHLWKVIKFLTFHWCKLARSPQWSWPVWVGPNLGRPTLGRPSFLGRPNGGQIWVNSGSWADPLGHLMGRPNGDPWADPPSIPGVSAHLGRPTWFDGSTQVGRRLGPLGFKCCQHSPTTRPSVESTAERAFCFRVAFSSPVQRPV